MKKPIIITLALAAAFTGATLLFSFRTAATTHATDLRNGTPPKGCVFKTIYEGEGLDPSFVLKTPAEVLTSETRG